MAQLFTNNFDSTLDGGITAAATTININAGDGALLQSPTGGDYELLTINDGVNIEIVQITTRSTDALTVIRAREGTTALVFPDETPIYTDATAGFFNSVVTADEGGNARGTDAVNIQSGRDSADEVANGSGAVAYGYGTKANSTNSLAFGKKAYATADNTTALGALSTARIESTHVITGPSISRKDNAEAAADAFKYFSSQQNILFSKEIDLTQTAADDLVTITIPSGATFFTDEIGMVVTDSNTVTVQPDVSFGNTGATESLLVQTSTTKSTAGSRERFETMITDDGLTTLTMSLKIAATATTMLARFYFKGVLVEDE